MSNAPARISTQQIDALNPYADDISPDVTAGSQGVDDAPRPEESDPFALQSWRTERYRQKSANAASERVPSEIYFAALGAFFSDGWIKDVRMLVQSGKEATVYCCEAHPSTGYRLLAAKVYRPVGVKHNRNPQAAYDEASLRHSFEKKVKVRTFTWDSRYREGRTIGDSRLQRAFERRTRTGREVQNSTWARSEYEVLQKLHRAGADVPRPLAQSGSSLLMEYVGDDEAPAPPLKGASIPSDRASDHFWRVISNISLWLDYGYVHADLSSHNLLYWQDRVVAIDFPQAVDAHVNPHAFDFLVRDVTNVCTHFGRYGVSVDAESLAWELWQGGWEPPLHISRVEFISRPDVPPVPLVEPVMSVTDVS